MDKLYQLEIIEEDTTIGQVKVHYTGYSSDEWRNKEDIVVVQPPKPGEIIMHVWLVKLNNCYTYEVWYF